MTMLSENGKMKKATIAGVPVYVRNFDIDRTSCHNAKLCAGSNCYVDKLEKLYPSYFAKIQGNLELTKRPEFVDEMDREVKYVKRTKRDHKNIIRIHASGDFYDATYLLKWVAIMKRNPDVLFYAYTKMVGLVKFVRDRFGLPENFVVIFSYGGKEDHLIDPSVDRHAFVFRDREAFDADYADASDNDMVAIDPSNHRIGLKYHALKKFEKSGWARVVRQSQKEVVA